MLLAFSAAAANPIREHPRSVFVNEDMWANFSCAIRLPRNIQWRIGDFTINSSQYNSGENLPQLQGVMAESSFNNITDNVLTETIGVLARAEVDGTPVECMFIHPEKPARNSYSKFALLNIHRHIHTAPGNHSSSEC